MQVKESKRASGLVTLQLSPPLIVEVSGRGELKFDDLDELIAKCACCDLLCGAALPHAMLCHASAVLRCRAAARSIVITWMTSYPSAVCNVPWCAVPRFGVLCYAMPMHCWTCADEARSPALLRFAVPCQMCAMCSGLPCCAGVHFAVRAVL